MIKAGKCVILKTKLYAATKQRDKPALREVSVRHRERGLRGLVYLEAAGAAPATWSAACCAGTRPEAGAWTGTALASSPGPPLHLT